MLCCLSIRIEHSLMSVRVLRITNVPTSMAVCSLGNKTLSVCKEIDKLKTAFQYICICMLTHTFDTPSSHTTTHFSLGLVEECVVVWEEGVSNGKDVTTDGSH